MCAARSLLPRSLQINMRYDLLGAARCRSRFADVWKANYGDREVAVKVWAISTDSNLLMVTRVSR
jgi:hypothetical protein